MNIAILKERRADEQRVAAAPETVGKLIGLGFSVAVEKGAGETAAFPDSAYKIAGATIAASALAASSPSAPAAYSFCFSVPDVVSATSGGMPPAVAIATRFASSCRFM